MPILARQSQLAHHAQRLTDVCGLEHRAITPLCLVLVQAVLTHLSSAPVLLFLHLRRRTVLSTAVKIVLALKGALGLVNFATMLWCLAPTTAVLILHLNVADALVMINVALVVDATRELVLPALETAIVIITLIAVAACRIQIVCGILIPSHIANPKSNATLLTVV